MALKETEEGTMVYAFYIASVIAIVATLRVITGTHAIHALLYLVVSLLAAAVIFFTLGAPFAAALEVIIYAGAIMVLFVFAVMMLSPGPRSVKNEQEWLAPRIWVGPAILAAILMGELIWILSAGKGTVSAAGQVTPKEVGVALFGSYLPAVEMASVLLLAALVGAYHLARHLFRGPLPENEETES
jgi:NADH-quinone oxidoreductase subunit J